MLQKRDADGTGIVQPKVGEIECPLFENTNFDNEQFVVQPVLLAGGSNGS